MFGLNRSWCICIRGRLRFYSVSLNRTIENGGGGKKRGDSRFAINLVLTKWTLYLSLSLPSFLSLGFLIIFDRVPPFDADRAG